MTFVYPPDQENSLKLIQVPIYIFQQILLEERKSRVFYFPQTEEWRNVFMDVLENDPDGRFSKLKKIDAITFTDIEMGKSSITFRIDKISEVVIPDEIDSNYPQEMHFKVDLGIRIN